MRKIIKTFRPALICFLAMTMLCGVLYTVAITGITQMLFPKQANGNIIVVTLKDGSQKAYGSSLIAQEFSKPIYLIGRPMGTTNLSPVSQEQKKRVEERIIWLRSLDPDNAENIPMDLVTGSGSGVDPHISKEAADYQVTRLARARNIEESAVRKVIKNNTTERFLGFLGEPSVNVLMVNLALDEIR